MISQAYSYPLLIKQLLITPLAHAPQQEIVYRDQVRYNYLALRQRIGRLANALSKLGAKHGSTVAIMDWDSHRYLECYFAVPMMGAILQTVNVRMSPEQILYTLNHAGADVLVVHHEFVPIVQQIKDKLDSVKTFIFIQDGDGTATAASYFSGEYEALINQTSGNFEFPDFDEDTRATTFYTTGTTGDPKGVYFSHKQLVIHTLATMAGICSPASGQRFHNEDVYMPITPMFHVHAWGYPYVATLMGVKQVYPGRYDADALVGLIRDEGVTFSHCVPTILRMLLNAQSAKHTDFSRWKVMVGGSAMPQALCKEGLALGIDIFAAYGMSETCPMVSIAQLKPGFDGTPEEALNLRCKTGRGIPLVQLSIVDTDMKEVPRDGKATGELVLRAPWLTQGYFKNAETSKELWRGGYLHTQDIGNIDPDGYLQITDRLKDVIKSGGEWISTIELENLISQHPAVGESAVFGIKDAKWGERPLALIVLRPGAAVSEEEIKAHLQTFVDNGHIPRYAIPHTVQIVSAIAKTSVGKINKKQLRQDFDPAGK